MEKLTQTARLHLTTLLSDTYEPKTFGEIREHLAGRGFSAQQSDLAIRQVGRFPDVALWAGSEEPGDCGLVWVHEKIVDLAIEIFDEISCEGVQVGFDGDGEATVCLRKRGAK